MMYAGNLENYTHGESTYELNIRSVLSTNEGPNDFSLLGLAQQRMQELESLREMCKELKNKLNGRNGF